MRLPEIFRAMARFSPSAPSGHLPRRGRSACQKITFNRPRMCRGDHWSPVNLPQQRIFWNSFLTRQTGTGEQCSPLQEFFDSLTSLAEGGFSTRWGGFCFCPWGQKLHHLYYFLFILYYLKKAPVFHNASAFLFICFYPIFMSTGFEIPLTLPEPVYCHILCL